MKSYRTVINEIQSSTWASFRLKKIIEELDEVDILKAVHETEVIRAIFLAKLKNMDFHDALGKVRRL